MNSLPDKVEVVCPKCGESFGGWQLSSLDPATASTCPNCGFQLAMDRNLREDGGWEPEVDEVELESR